jgi:putative transposase
MSYVKVFIHFVWCTKNREQFLGSSKIRKKVWQHIRKNGREKGLHIDFVNGYSDHCHCVVSLGFDQTIKKVMQLIKGESSFWINKNKLTDRKFEWQDEYFAVSVSESMINPLREYLKNQEKHHEQKSFQEEYEEIIKKHGFKKIKD